MRASAIAAFVYKSKGTLETALQLAQLDANLSHPNAICKEINAIYVHASYLLLHNQYDISKTYDYISQITNQQVQTTIVQWLNMSSTISQLHSGDGTSPAPPGFSPTYSYKNIAYFICTIKKIAVNVVYVVPTGQIKVHVH
jgi:hypothetical protein